MSDQVVTVEDPVAWPSRLEESMSATPGRERRPEIAVFDASAFAVQRYVVELAYDVIHSASEGSVVGFPQSWASSERPTEV